MIDPRTAALYGRYYLSFLILVEERVGVISICIDGLCFLYFTSFFLFFGNGCFCLRCAFFSFLFFDGAGGGSMSVCEAISLQFWGGRGGGEGK